MANGFRAYPRHPDPAKHYPAKPKLVAVATLQSVDDARDAVIATIELLDVELRRPLFVAPIGDDPLYEMLCELYPDGVPWQTVARVYGVSKQAVFIAWGKARAKFLSDREYCRLAGLLTEDRGHTAWDEAFLFAEAG